jgi:hypothetical protein
MPVNIAITFMIGGTLGWIACNILKPPQHFRGLIMAFCSAGSVSSLDVHVSFSLQFFLDNGNIMFNLHACRVDTSVMDSTNKRRKPRKPAPDHCPGCMRRRREPVWGRFKHLPLTQPLLLVLVHGCKGLTNYLVCLISHIHARV